MDLTHITPNRAAELRAIITRNLVECCDGCRAMLRKQLEDEEFRKESTE